LIVDAQSVKNTDTGGRKGYDAGKKVSGIKRHIGGDTQGLPHAIAVTTAEVTDRKGALQAMQRGKAGLDEIQSVLAHSTWQTVYQQTQRWLKAGSFEIMTHDLRMLLRMTTDWPPRPTAAVIDSRTLQSTRESGGRAGYDGAKRRKGSKSIWPSIRWSIC
jgi:hypothetical protein